MALRSRMLEMTDSGGGSTTKADDQKSRKRRMYSRHPPTPQLWHKQQHRLLHKQPPNRKTSVTPMQTIVMRQQTPAADMIRTRLWYGILIVPNARL